jgi:hypothetical protein
MDSALAIQGSAWLFGMSVVVFCLRWLMPKSWVDERQIPIGIAGAFLFASAVAGITGVVLMLADR